MYDKRRHYRRSIRSHLQTTLHHNCKIGQFDPLWCAKTRWSTRFKRGKAFAQVRTPWKPVFPVPIQRFIRVESRCYAVRGTSRCGCPRCPLGTGPVREDYASVVNVLGRRELVFANAAGLQSRTQAEAPTTNGRGVVGLRPIILETWGPLPNPLSTWTIQSLDPWCSRLDTDMSLLRIRLP